MKKQILICAAACGVAFVGADLSSLMAAPSAKEAPLRIAVVDIDKVLDGWKKAREESVRQDVEEQAFMAEKANLQKEVEALDQAVKIHNGKAKQDKEQELETKKRAYIAHCSVEGGRLNRLKAEFLARSYRGISAAVEACAKQDGIDLVFVTETQPEFAGGKDHDEMMKNFRDFQQGIVFHKILYARADLDITQKVLDHLNAADKSK